VIKLVTQRPWNTRTVCTHLPLECDSHRVCIKIPLNVISNFSCTREFPLKPASSLFRLTLYITHRPIVHYVLQQFTQRRGTVLSSPHRRADVYFSQIKADCIILESVDMVYEGLYSYLANISGTSMTAGGAFSTQDVRYLSNRFVDDLSQRYSAAP
jgi:hypothetical protein